jgi:hypothetical protein
MKSGTYSMILNVDGYTGLDGWLDVNDTIILGSDPNYAVAGSVVDNGGALKATMTFQPSATNQTGHRARVDDAVLSGTDNATGFSLLGTQDGIDVELRCRYRGR